MKLQHVKSSFPIAVGADISAVDSDTFSATGKAFSFISLPNAESSTEKTLQEDDVSPAFRAPAPLRIRCPLLTPPSLLRSQISLAYEFASKFPGYTAESAAFRARPFAIRIAHVPRSRSQQPLGEGRKQLRFQHCRVNAAHLAAP